MRREGEELADELIGNLVENYGAQKAHKVNLLLQF